MMWGRGYGYGWGNMMGFGWFGWLLMLMFGVMVVACVVLVILWALRASNGHGRHGGTSYPGARPGHDEAVAIAKRRLANGEISKEQYEEIMRSLGT